MRTLRIIAQAAVAFYEELFFYALLGVVNIVAWLLVIPGPFALTALYIVGQRAVRGLGVNWSLIWDGVKEYGLRAWLLFVVAILGFIIVFSNLVFYVNPDLSPFPESVGMWTTPFFLLVGLIWTGVVFYAQSFLMELEDPKFGLVLRNSLFLVLLQPLQTLTLLLVSLLATALSIVLPVLLLLLPGFLSCLSLTAVRELVAYLKERAETLNKADEADGATENQSATGSTGSEGGLK